MKKLIIAATAAVMIVGTAGAGFARSNVPIDGAALYSANCQSCHQAIEETTIDDPTPRTIRKEMKVNSQMNGLKKIIKNKQAKAISLAIRNIQNPPPPPPPPPPDTSGIDGSALYYLDCMPCHNGITAVTGIKNRRRITGQQVFDSMKGGNHAGTTIQYTGTKANALERAIKLTAAEAEAIALAVRKESKPADGSDVYAQPECSNCHNSDGSRK